MPKTKLFYLLPIWKCSETKQYFLYKSEYIRHLKEQAKNRRFLKVKKSVNDKFQEMRDTCNFEDLPIWIKSNSKYFLANACSEEQYLLFDQHYKTFTIDILYVKNYLKNLDVFNTEKPKLISYFDYKHQRLLTSINEAYLFHSERLKTPLPYQKIGYKGEISYEISHIDGITLDRLFNNSGIYLERGYQNTRDNKLKGKFQTYLYVEDFNHIYLDYVLKKLEHN